MFYVSLSHDRCFFLLCFLTTDSVKLTGNFFESLGVLVPEPLEAQLAGLLLASTEEGKHTLEQSSMMQEEANEGYGHREERMYDVDDEGVVDDPDLDTMRSLISEPYQFPPEDPGTVFDVNEFLI